MMIPAVIEKASFGIATLVLFSMGRMGAMMLGAGLIDLSLGALFVIAYVRNPGVRLEILTVASSTRWCDAELNVIFQA
jgi:hypothetical protein